MIIQLRATKTASEKADANRDPLSITFLCAASRESLHPPFVTQFAWMLPPHIYLCVHGRLCSAATWTFTNVTERWTVINFSLSLESSSHIHALFIWCLSISSTQHSSSSHSRSQPLVSVGLYTRLVSLLYRLYRHILAVCLHVAGLQRLKRNGPITMRSQVQSSSDQNQNQNFLSFILNWETSSSQQPKDSGVVINNNNSKRINDTIVREVIE